MNVTSMPAERIKYVHSQCHNVQLCWDSIKLVKTSLLEVLCGRYKEPFGTSWHFVQLRSFCRQERGHPVVPWTASSFSVVVRLHLLPPGHLARCYAPRDRGRLSQGLQAWARHSVQELTGLLLVFTSRCVYICLHEDDIYTACRYADCLRSQ